MYKKHLSRGYNFIFHKAWETKPAASFCVSLRLDYWKRQGLVHRLTAA